MATVAAVYEVTNTPAIAAMNAGSLYDVALVVRELAPMAEIVFLADNDIADTDKNVGVEKARYAAKKVGSSVAIPNMGAKKCDFWDLWHEKGEQAVLRAINNANKNVTAELKDTEDKRKNQAEELVEFVKSRVELFHDKNRHVYAQDLSTRETRRLDGNQFKDWLFSSFYSATKKSPREQSIREALNILSGLARYEGECREVHIR
ncbi:MAG: hypothetical protein K2Q33_00865, partial [Gammaproteobacteria bacterium]|nr:hypothetical protein [Gammaproteobacteria bacterium]